MMEVIGVVLVAKRYGNDEGDLPMAVLLFVSSCGIFTSVLPMLSMVVMLAGLSTASLWMNQMRPIEISQPSAPF